MKKIIEYLLPFIAAILILTMGLYLREVTREAVICAILVSIVAMVIAFIIMWHLGEKEMERMRDVSNSLEDKIRNFCEQETEKLAKLTEEMETKTQEIKNLGTQKMERLSELVDELEIKTKRIRDPGFAIKIPGLVGPEELVKVWELNCKEEWWAITPALRFDDTIFKEADIKYLTKGYNARYIISNEAKPDAINLIKEWENTVLM